MYRLPVDIYKTARVLKVLLLMEKGVPVEFKAGYLAEIEIRPDEQIETCDENAVEVEVYLNIFLQSFFF